MHSFLSSTCIFNSLFCWKLLGVNQLFNLKCTVIIVWILILVTCYQRINVFFFGHKNMTLLHLPDYMIQSSLPVALSISNSGQFSQGLEGFNSINVETNLGGQKIFMNNLKKIFLYLTFNIDCFDLAKQLNT